jgi:hypothetical protein
MIRSAMLQSIAQPYHNSTLHCTRAPQSVLLRRQYPELSQQERAVKISPLPCQAIVLVKGKDGTKWKLNPASGGRNPTPLILMGATECPFENDCLVAHVASRDLKVEVGKARAHVRIEGPDVLTATKFVVVNLVNGGFVQSRQGPVQITIHLGLGVLVNQGYSRCDAAFVEAMLTAS